MSTSAQRGFVLFELLLGAAVALLIAVWASQALIHRLDDASAQHSANWMLMVRNGVHSYLEHHADRLRLAVAPADLLAQGYQDWTAPQISELKADGFLAAGFPEHMRRINGVQVHVLRDGDCPGDECRIGAIIYSQQAFVKASDVVDEQMLAQWQLASKGLGGVVHPAQPDIIRGQTFRYPNPPHGGLALPSGTVAMAISDDQLSEHAYLRVRDKRDPQFQSDATVQGNIAAGGGVSAGGHLYLESAAQWLDGCTADGAVTRDRLHGLLICTRGVWQFVSRSSGGFSTNSHYGCMTPEGRSSANPVTQDCSCPVGHASVLISEGSGDDSERGMTRGYLCVR